MSKEDKLTSNKEGNVSKEVSSSWKLDRNNIEMHKKLASMRQVVTKANVDVFDWNKFFEKFKNVTVVDFETTGLGASYERVIEIGASKVKDGEIVDDFSMLCNPEKPLSSKITEITGITDEMVANRPTSSDGIKQLKKFIGGKNEIVVTHNASFDASFFCAEMLRLYPYSKVSGVCPSFVCSLILARHLMPGLDKYKLSVLRELINFVPGEGHQDHRALSDVHATVALFKHLREVAIAKPAFSLKPIEVKPHFTSHKESLSTNSFITCPLTNVKPSVVSVVAKKMLRRALK